MFADDIVLYFGAKGINTVETWLNDDINSDNLSGNELNVLF